VKIISHRGNLYGPNPSTENSPDQLLRAIALGYDVEVDVWYVDGKIMLGHDHPQHEVDKQFINKIINSAWFHCKNVQAMAFFDSQSLGYNYFWHQNDDYALTSHKILWTFPGLEVDDRCVVVMPEAYGKTRSEVINYWGICTDYCIEYDPSYPQ
jgi:hypothetical protein